MAYWWDSTLYQPFRCQLCFVQTCVETILSFHWSLVQWTTGPYSSSSADCMAPNGRQAITWTNYDPIHLDYWTLVGLNDWQITERCWHQGWKMILPFRDSLYDICRWYVDLCWKGFYFSRYCNTDIYRKISNIRRTKSPNFNGKSLRTFI